MISPINVFSARTKEEFLSFLQSSNGFVQKQIGIEEQYAIKDRPYHIDGFCVVCSTPTKFLVDDDCGFHTATGIQVNWRERLVCSSCGLNNRMRAALHFIEHNLGALRSDVLYLTEQLTPMYTALTKRYPILLGSEFLSDGTPRGAHNSSRIRFEDVTKLTFEGESIDCILTFDVLEHVPDYHAAIREFFRCLRARGKILISIPFALYSAETVTRARLGSNGEIEHILVPSYHGDPLNATGILCFYDFGWDFLDELRDAGFVNSALHFYWSLEYGYLGHAQFLISAERP